MSDISTVTVNNTTYDIKDETARTDNATHHIYYVKGTQTETTGSWTGVLSDVDALYEGLEIAYWLPYAGSGNATLNLTLKGGNTTGAINCYHTSTNRLTTHLAQYSWCHLIYQTVNISGTNYTGWWMLKAYDSNDRAAIMYRCGNSYYYANSVVYRYQILFRMDANMFTPLNNANNDTGTSKTMLTEVEFDPLGEILYWESTSTINANGAISNTAKWSCNLDLRYTFNCGSTLTANRDIYMKTILQPNGKVRIANAMPIVQELPSTNDGYLYIYLGRAYSTYQISLYPVHPVYYHDGTGIKEYRNLPKDTQADYGKTGTGIVHLYSENEYGLTKLCATMSAKQDLSNGDPSPTNWVEIEGVEDIKIYHTGTNIIVYNVSSGTSGNLTITVNDDGSITFSGSTGSSAYSKSVGSVSLKANTMYRISGNNGVSNITMELRESGTVRYSNSSNSETIIIPTEDEYLDCYYKVSASSSIDGTVYPMVYIAKDATTVANYEKSSAVNYSYGFTYDGLCYGGIIELASGRWLDTHKMNVYSGADSENWLTGVSSNNLRYFYIQVTDAIYQSTGRIKVLCDRGKYGDEDAVGCVYLKAVSTNMFLYYFPAQTITTVADFKTWLSYVNLTVVYELKETLLKGGWTGTSTSYKKIISAWKGDNYYWTDNGDDITVEYLPMDDLSAPTIRTNLGLTSIATRPNYTYSTTDLVTGTSSLETGKLYFVYS